jgi:hypothetical protein
MVVSCLQSARKLVESF